MVVGFQSYIAAFVEQVFEVEVADKRIVVDGVVAVTDISVDDEPVVEELARQCYFDLYIGKIAFVAAQIGSDIDVFIDLPQQVIELARQKPVRCCGFVPRSCSRVYKICSRRADR